MSQHADLKTAERSPDRRDRGEEESLQRRTDCIDTARSRIEHGDGHGASAWGGRANDLSMAAVLRHGGRMSASCWRNAIWSTCNTESGIEPASSSVALYYAAFRDGVSICQGAPGPVVVSGVADRGTGRSELGLPAGRWISAAARLATQ